MTRGGRNLIILGVSSVVVATITTGVALAIYHNSGDIYLDRSRPGFLPDEKEISEEIKEDYEFDKSGTVTKQVITEYLENLETEVKALDNYKEPFSSEALSDERLGIKDGQGDQT